MCTPKFRRNTQFLTAQGWGSLMKMLVAQPREGEGTRLFRQAQFFRCGGKFFILVRAFCRRFLELGNFRLHHR